MITRIWHGWTTLENADVYQQLLFDKVFPGIESKKVSGYKSIQLLRREMETEVEFITIMQFDNLDSLEKFAGENYAEAYVPEDARKVLKRFDSHSQHYEVKKTITY